MTKVLIVDDHAVFRRGLKDILLECCPDYKITDLSRGLEVLNRVKNEPWDVLILDISLPDINGIELLKQVKLLKPNLPVLMLSMYDENQYALRALKAGASGYLTKESVPTQIVDAIHKALLGKKYVSGSFAEKLALEYKGESSKLPHERLSDRELEVLRLLASGKRVSEIARHLHLSVKTISTHRTRLLEKMDMRSNAELIHYAINNHLVP